MTGNLTILLSGDASAPGNSYLYSTNAFGVKGWNALSAYSIGWAQLTSVPSTFPPTLPIPWSGLSGVPPMVNTLTAIDSITTAGSGNITISLVNDVVTPADGTYYGKVSGARGWFQIAYSQISGTPTLPVALTSTVGGLTPNVTPNDSSKVLLGSGVWGTLSYANLGSIPSTFPPTLPIPWSGLSGVPTFAGSAAGLVPVSSGGTTTYLRADGAFAAVSYASLTGVPPIAPSTTTTASLAVPNVNASVIIAVVAAPWSVVGQILEINDGTNFGFFEVLTVNSTISLTIVNRAYAGTTIASGTMASGAGVVLAAIGLATATRAGLLPVPPNLTTQFLRGDASWQNISSMSVGWAQLTSVPALSTSQAGLAPQGDNNDAHFLRGDASWATPPSATATVAGYVPTPPNNTTSYLRGDATWATPPGITALATTSSIGAVPALPPAGSGSGQQTMTFLRGDDTWQPYNSFDNSPVGAITNWAESGSPPAGWLQANGAAVSRTLYSTLFAEIGTTYGAGDGSTTFNLPNLAGDFPALPATDTQFLRDDGTWQPIPTATATAGGLLPIPSNDSTQWLRGDATFQDMPVGYRKRYYYAFDCDHPASGATTVVSSGTGAAISYITGVPDHHGIWALGSGTANNGYTYYSSSSAADILLSEFVKLAFRAVVRTPVTLPTSTAATNAIWKVGFVQALGTTGVTDGILFNFNPANNAAWQFQCVKASVLNLITTAVTVVGNTYYDIQIYWDANGVQARIGVWGNNLQPALVSGGPFTTDLPATSTALFWELLSINGASGTTNFNLLVDLVEVCGEFTDLGQMRGDALVTNF